MAENALQPAPLFRTEVTVHRQAQWLGTVLLTPRPSHRWVSMVAVAIAAAIIALVWSGHFTRTARIGGWLVPDAGVVRVFAPHAGVVTSLHVKEGAEIRKGTPLLTLSAETQSAALGATQAEIARRLAERRRILHAERRQQERLLAQQQRALANRIAALRAEEEYAGHEIALLRSRVGIAERAEAMHSKLARQGFISDLRLQQVESETLEQKARAGALERSRLGLARERLALQSELQDLPLKAQKEIAALEHSLAALEQELASTESRREIVISAPQDGTVTAVLAELGGHAGTAVPLLSIVPAGTQLEAHLYGPSRAVGFVQPGQRVQIRYQAYPYQKFGHYEGTVASVSRSTVNPAELPAQFATQGGNAAEPVYRITVRLDSQAVRAYGAAMSLQPGMQLEADIALEKRRLIEWALDPLFTLTGKWQG
ncbi:MAG: HlyD family efflux transporter periplasmic adaptor subunit [Betaproteobacteria bacterium]|nr:HlyD family efflux transporter periplasmic adaptor subunit [Betaproteobacteria bacterium]